MQIQGDIHTIREAAIKAFVKRQIIDLGSKCDKFTKSDTRDCGAFDSRIFSGNPAATIGGGLAADFEKARLVL